MSDESVKPVLPRRPYNRKPEKIKPLRKKDERNPEQVATDCLALTVIEQACAIICVERDKESAAIELNMSLTEVNEIMASAPVRLFLQKLQDKTITELAKVKVRRMRKVGICKASIEQQLMHLMMLDPSETKGTVDGQVRAASLLLEKCGYGKEQDPTEGKTPEELREMILRGAKFIEGSKATPVN
jgi:hypothetical protein